MNMSIWLCKADNKHEQCCQMGNPWTKLPKRKLSTANENSLRTSPPKGTYDLYKSHLEKPSSGFFPHLSCFGANFAQPGRLTSWRGLSGEIFTRFLYCKLSHISHKHETFLQNEAKEFCEMVKESLSTESTYFACLFLNCYFSPCFFSQPISLHLLLCLFSHLLVLPFWFPGGGATADSTPHCKNKLICGVHLQLT